MKRVAVTCCALLAASAVAAPRPARQEAGTARPYTMLYVFGDSYSDSGAGFVDADGPTAVVYLAQRLSIPFTYYGDPSSKGKGLNFAVSGAPSGEAAGRRWPTGQLLGFGLANQVDDFVHFYTMGALPRFDADKTMFYLAGGLNDGGRPQGSTRVNIEAEIDALYAVGARRFMVAILPVKMPEFTLAGERGNRELLHIPEEEQAKHPGIRIAISRWGAFFDEVLSHAAKYGITDTTHACAQRSFQHNAVAAPCADPGAHFYYYPAHPSTAVHKAVGEMLYQEALTMSH